MEEGGGGGTTMANSSLMDGIFADDARLVEEARDWTDEKLRRERLEDMASRQREEISDLRDAANALVRRERTWERTTSELIARLALLKKREGAWERTITELAGEVEVRGRREEGWTYIKAGLEDGIRRLSRDAARARFGPGPHHVSMIVALDDDGGGDHESESGGGGGRREREIVFQLAPLDLMPHSVNLFLSQVAGGYWSRGSPAFAISAGHVLQACPHPCLEHEDLGGNLSGYAYADMARAGLDAVRYQEYSTMIPHAKYTIGYAGRPRSGPEFYVNLADNTLDHGTPEERDFRMGPRRHAAWAASEAAEGTVDEPYPCFGRVISGFDVVDEIAGGMTWARLPKGDEEEEGEGGEVRRRRRLDDNILVRPVRIVSATILEDYDPKGSGGGSSGKKESGNTNDEL